MIKAFGLTAVLLAASVTPSVAGIVEWRGAAVLTAVSGCGTDWLAGNSIPFRYRPSGIPGNDTSSKFGFHQTFFAHAYQHSGRFPKTMVAVDAVYISAYGGLFATPAKFQMTSITPAAYTATTPSLAFVGSIENFGNTAGCNVSFRASGALKD